MKSKLIILSIATLLGCVSCNTIGGVGKDVEAVGSDINSAARSTSSAACTRAAAQADWFVGGANHIDRQGRCVRRDLIPSPLPAAEIPTAIPVFFLNQFPRMIGAGIMQTKDEAIP